MVTRQYHFGVHTADETYSNRCNVADEHVQQDDEEETESSPFTPSSLPVNFGKRE